VIERPPHGQHIQTGAGQRDGVEEVDGDERLGLGAQERRPRAARAIRCRIDASALEDLLYRRGGNLHPEHEQFTVDTPISPAGILRGQTQDQRADRPDRRWPSGPAGPGSTGPQLFANLSEPARRKLLTIAGYRSLPEAEPAWARTGRGVTGARLFTVGSLLTDLDYVLRQLRPATPDEGCRALRVPLRHRETIAIHAGAIHAARPAFRQFWASCSGGFRAALLGYGSVTAGPACSAGSGSLT
jgi:hypothetical protein